MTLALCAFLLAQRAAARRAPRSATGCSSRTRRRRGATLTKGLVALVIPGAALVLYTLVTRDTGPWRRLHRAARPRASTSRSTAPWFVLVSRANPGVRAVLLHPRARRALPHRDAQPRPASGGTSCRGSLLGIMPWLLVWAVTLPRSWRDAPRAANGFSWERFCLVWAAFIFVFFSMSGSKLPSYILPMFPALALVLGFELTRLSPRTLMWIALPLAVGGARCCWSPTRWLRARRSRRSPSDATPADDLSARSARGCSRRSPPYTAGGIAAFALFRSGGTARAKTLRHRRRSRCRDARRHADRVRRATTRSRACARRTPILRDARARQRPAARSRASRVPGRAATTRRCRSTSAGRRRSSSTATRWRSASTPSRDKGYNLTRLDRARGPPRRRPTR